MGSPTIDAPVTWTSPASEISTCCNSGMLADVSVSRRRAATLRTSATLSYHSIETPRARISDSVIRLLILGFALLLRREVAAAAANGYVWLPCFNLNLPPGAVSRGVGGCVAHDVAAAEVLDHASVLGPQARYVL